MKTNMTPLEKLKAVSTKVQDWVENTFLPSFKTKKEMYYNSLGVAAVGAMQDWLDEYLIPTIKDDGEEALESIFWEVSVDEFYDFFFKYERTFVDIFDSWMGGGDPSSADILGLLSCSKQTEEVLAAMRNILNDLRGV